MANVGSADRIVRAILGIVLVVAPFVPATSPLFGGWSILPFLAAAIGLVLIGTAAIRFCPLYALFGVNTCPVEHR